MTELHYRKAKHGWEILKAKEKKKTRTYIPIPQTATHTFTLKEAANTGITTQLVCTITTEIKEPKQNLEQQGEGAETLPRKNFQTVADEVYATLKAWINNTHHDTILINYQIENRKLKEKLNRRLTRKAALKVKEFNIKEVTLTN